MAAPRVPPVPDGSPTGIGSIGDQPRPPAVEASRWAATGPWLVLADGGPAEAAAEAAGGRVATIVRDGATFRSLLARLRPRLVLAVAPPADPIDLALLADVRRRRPGLRMILIDEPAAVEERLGALRAGFDEALPSSIGAIELLGRIRLLVARAPVDASRGGPRVRHVAPGLDVDLVARVVRREGRPFHVRPMEFALLAALAAHPGRAFRRDELLRLVWGTDRGSDPRTVDVHVRWLRAKIEPDPARPRHLVTVRGVGYRLDPAPLTEP
jgi:two-component system, OmpR family, response regulator MtrA